MFQTIVDLRHNGAEAHTILHTDVFGNHEVSAGKSMLRVACQGAVESQIVDMGGECDRKAA